MKHFVYLVKTNQFNVAAFKIGHAKDLAKQPQVWVRIGGEDSALLAFIPCRTRREAITLNTTLCRAFAPFRLDERFREFFGREPLIEKLFMLHGGRRVR